MGKEPKCTRVWGAGVRVCEGTLAWDGAGVWKETGAWGIGVQEIGRGLGVEKGQLDRGLGWGRSLGVQEPGKGTEVWVCEGTLAWDGAEVWKDAGAWEFIIVWEGPGVGKGLNAGA